MTSRTDPVAVPVHASAAARRDRLMGLLCALVVVALFSGFTLVSRLGFSSALKLPDVAALRFGIGGLLLLPVLLNKRLGAVTWPQAAVLAFFGGLGFALFAYGGFLLAPASHGAVLLHGTLPLFTFLAVRLLGSAPAGKAPRFGPGLAMILAGIVAMSWDSWASATPRQLAGDGCLLLASICWSIYGVIVKRLKIAPAHAASIVAVLSMAVYLPVYFFLPGKALAAAAWSDILIQAVFQGVFLGVVSIFVYTRAVALLGAQETALFTAAVPCITTGLAVVLLGEIPTAAALVGVAIVTAGMVVAMRKT